MSKKKRHSRLFDYADLRITLARTHKRVLFSAKNTVILNRISGEESREQNLKPPNTGSFAYVQDDSGFSMGKAA